MIYRLAFKIREIAREHGVNPCFFRLVYAISRSKTTDEIKANVKEVVHAYVRA